ncbi:MAG TPA: hypothetical protein PLP98_15930, partial [Plasticicumulans sp.]|nr:hypothetical protein [Plasticicumulans sp.]
MALNVVHEHDSTRVIRSLHLAGAGFTFSPASSAVEHPMPRGEAQMCGVVERLVAEQVKTGQVDAIRA